MNNLDVIYLNTVVKPVQNAEQSNLNDRPQGKDFSWYLDQVSKKSQKNAEVEEVSQDNTSEIAALQYGYLMMDSLLRRKESNKK